MKVLTWGESRWRVYGNFILYLQLLHKSERVLKWKIKGEKNKSEDSIQPQGPWILDFIDRGIYLVNLGPEKDLWSNGPHCLYPDPARGCSQVTVVVRTSRGNGQYKLSPSIFSSLITHELLGIAGVWISGSHLSYINWKSSVPLQPGGGVLMTEQRYLRKGALRGSHTHTSNPYYRYLPFTAGLWRAQCQFIQETRAHFCGCRFWLELLFFFFFGWRVYLFNICLSEKETCVRSWGMRLCWFRLRRQLLMLGNLPDVCVEVKH